MEMVRWTLNEYLLVVSKDWVDRLLHIMLMVLMCKVDTEHR